MFPLGVIKQAYVITIIIGILVMLHSTVRPVAIELSRKKTPKVVAPDGFIDDADAADANLNEGSNEETVLFSQSSNLPGLVTSSRSIGSDGGRNSGVSTCSKRPNARLSVSMINEPSLFFTAENLSPVSSN